jgi:hypothetical protein
VSDSIFLFFVTLEDADSVTAALLCQQLDVARKEQVSQREVFETFSLQQADRVPAWKKMVEDFEKDSMKKNPYQMEISGRCIRRWCERGRTACSDIAYS